MTSGTVRYIMLILDMRKMKKIILPVILTIFAHTAYAYDMKNIAAYPVPFNPQKNMLKIGLPAGVSEPHTSVRIEIFDINGDTVMTRSASSLPVIWNGRNTSGGFVKPGLYMVKIEIDDNNGDYGKKVIRILVDY